MIEVHVGVPHGTGSLELFEGLNWSRVFDTVAGTDAGQEYLGHGVDGQLAVIGTARPQLKIRSFIRRAAIISRKLSGSRLEIEAIDEDAASIFTKLGNTMLELEQTKVLERVPAPLYERHIKIRNDQGAELLSNSIGALLAEHTFFELTTFGPEDPRSVVTVAADTPEEIAEQTTTILRALHGYGEIELGPKEEVVGAWRSAA